MHLVTSFARPDTRVPHAPRHAGAAHPRPRTFHRLLAIMAILGLAAVTTVAGCAGGSGHDHKHTTVGALAAPTDLGAMSDQNAVHLAWTDNSPDEDLFMVMRRELTGTYADIGETLPNVTEFHDNTALTGKTYVYMVHAMRGTTASGPSNEVTISL